MYGDPECPICGSDDTELIIDDIAEMDDLIHQYRNEWRCRNCGCDFVENILFDLEDVYLYPTDDDSILIHIDGKDIRNARPWSSLPKYREGWYPIFGYAEKEDPFADWEEQPFASWKRKRKGLLSRLFGGAHAIQRTNIKE